LHLNNISTKLEIFITKLEIFSIRMASQQHQHEAGNLQHKADITTTSTQAGNLQHKAGINTTPPFEGGPFGLHQDYLESAQTLHEI
jgi:hypothetical protein